MKLICTFSFTCLFIIHVSFSQNNSRCFNGEYVSGVDTINIGIESKAIISKKYTAVFTFSYYPRNKPKKNKTQTLYCIQIDSVFYLAKDSTYFNLRRFHGYFAKDGNMIIADGAMLSYVPDKKNILIEDVTWLVTCGDNEEINVAPEVVWGQGDPTDFDGVDPIYDVCEVEPSFPGGTNAMMEFISANFVLPSDYWDYEITGNVYVQFVVEKDGSLTDIKIIKGANEALNREALRVVASMPNWIPGTQNGLAVRVRYIIPIGIEVR